MTAIRKPTESEILPSSYALDDGFGSSVSISGTYAIIGAGYDDDDYNGSNSGSTYIFERNGSSWSQVAKFTTSAGNAGDHFGESVSISGLYAIVGAPYDGTYIFQRSGNSWNQVAKLTASDSYVDPSFGLSVSISGGYVLVGAPGVAATVG
jgi:hypothetical protein